MKFKFREDEYIKEIFEYVEKTYGQHYAKQNDKVQTFELISQGKNMRGVHFCTGNVMKYIDRFGEKDGYNRKDLLKAIHYLILGLYSFDEHIKQEEEEKQRLNQQAVQLSDGVGRKIAEGGGTSLSSESVVVKGRMMDD